MGLFFFEINPGWNNNELVQEYMKNNNELVQENMKNNNELVQEYIKIIMNLFRKI